MESTFKHIRPGDTSISASQYNNLLDIVKNLRNSSLQDGMIDSGGTVIRRRPPSSSGTELAVYEVQSAGTGDGIYNCYKQKLLNAEWADTAGDDRLADLNTTSVEVLNLLEHHSNATYAGALIATDRMAVWSITDDSSNSRLVGVPLNHGQVRQAKTQEAAPADTKILVKLVDQDDAEVGAEFDVNCRITRSANLNSAVPRLASGDYIFVANIAGKWWCVQTFEVTEDCDCYEV